jgi:hypothetical protein
MNKALLEQLHEESDSWKRLLEFIQLENTSIKLRIGDITARNISNDYLATSEEFQQRCIRKDELVAALKREVQDFDALLGRLDAASSTAAIQRALDKQRQLRNDIKTLSQRFHQLKFSFHDFVAENF